MKRVQFDENLNAKHLVKACQTEGRIAPIRFPREFAGRGVKDPDVLSALLPSGNLIVTNDRRFAEDHLPYVPERHGGILVVAQDDDVVGFMTSYITQRILAEFKQAFLGWDSALWNNSIVCVTRKYIHVLHVASGVLERDCFIDRGAGAWDQQLTAVLAVNAKRGQQT